MAKIDITKLESVLPEAEDLFFRIADVMGDDLTVTEVVTLAALYVTVCQELELDPEALMVTIMKAVNNA